jgi:hypothetical protein
VERCREAQGGSIDQDRREALTTALRRCVLTFARPVVRTLDPARDSSSDCAISLSLSSTGNRRRTHLRRRSETIAMLLSVGACEPPDDAHFTCVGWSRSLRIFPYGCVRCEEWRIGYARVGLRLSIVDAPAHRPFPVRRRRPRHPRLKAVLTADPNCAVWGGERGRAS